MPVSLSFLVLAGTLLAAGPDIPCTNCEEPVADSVPRSGWWLNPEEPGTGLNIEVQNRFLFGSIFLYREDGSSQWLLFQGEIPEKEEGVPVIVAGDLQSFGNGACLGCPFSESQQQPTPGPFELEIITHNQLTLSLLGGEPVTMVPFVFRYPTYDFFAPDVEYGFPELEGDWIVEIFNPDPRFGDWGRSAEAVDFTAAFFDFSDATGAPRLLDFGIASRPFPPELLIVGDLRCDVPAGPEGGLPACRLSYAGVYAGSDGRVRHEYKLRYTDIGVDRIEGVSNDELALRIVFTRSNIRPQ